MIPSRTLEQIQSKFSGTEFIVDGHYSPTFLPQVDRKALAALFAELGFKVGAEIGVEQGRYSEVLLRANPGLKLFCVDAWARYSKYRDHVSQEKLDGFCRATEERLKQFDAVLVRAYSADAARQFRKDSLDFVYIDANHSLPFVIQDIHLWSEKVRPGGIVAGHDYIRYVREQIQCHVVEAVHAWVRSYRIAPWFILGPRSEKLNPAEGKAGRRARSWMWVKEG
jgi:hypothetical protein